jgi:ribonuclease E
MSRQRIRTGVLEGSTVVCPHCVGAGAMERGELAAGPVEPLARDMVRIDSIRPMDIPLDEEEDEAGDDESEAGDDAEAAGETETDAESDARRKRRRRRRRGRGAEREGSFAQADAPQPSDDGLAFVAEIGGDLARPATGSDEDESSEGGEGAGDGRKRRRSRRGGRRNRFMGDQPADETAASPELTAQDEAIVHDVESEHPVESGEPTPEIDGGWVATLPPAPIEIPAETLIPPAQDERVEIVVAEPVAPQPEKIDLPDADVDPDRPKRSGWWQRAKTTFGG